MSHRHNSHDGYEHCHDDLDLDDHEHSTETGLADNLYSHIDLANVAAFNVSDDTPGVKALKLWHERLDETVWVESDADDQMIIRIPFTGSVKLRSVLLKSGPGNQTPAKICLFANEDNVDFSDISEKDPAQDFAIPQGRDIGEYAVKASKFANLSSLTLFVPAAQGSEKSRIYFIGLRGSWTERKRDTVITVYESRPNLADHEKIQGTDGGIDARLGS
ncbi:DUF1000-domain-containing protein [Phellopilus nigrolimitatus]|nr:DUF1000-domain-containing protein [Phellopilus nigrolimitatus]